MIKIYEKRMAYLREHFEIPDGKLQLEQGKLLPKLAQETPPENYHAKYMLRLKQKYGIERLELE